MIKVYFSPHVTRKMEGLFFEQLMTSLPEASWVKKSFPIPLSLIKEIVSRDDLITRFMNDSLLPVSAKDRCLAALSHCPHEIVVASQPNRVSVDIVVVKDGTPFYIEFHEKQHRSLSVSRPSLVYDLDGNRFDVPRSLQRLIRDIWRARNLRPYTIVWWDWFEQHSGEYEPVLDGNNREYGLPGVFSFKDFLS